MKLIVGLGNPGPRYERTRHNAGFLALDNYSFVHDLGSFTDKPKLSASIIETDIDGQRVLLAKPTTFMNRSGEALVAIKRYYSVDSATTLLIYDDIDLKLGTIRVRHGGSSGGHNGIRSLPPVVLEKSFRIRIGVSNDLRTQKDASDYVLERFLPQEIDLLPQIFTKTDELIESFIKDTISESTSSLSN